MEFLDFLLFAILGIYIIRTIARIVLPMLFQKVVNKAQQQQQTQQQQYQQTYTRSTTQGKIKVDYMPKTKKGSVPDSEGEFVDYEEIK